MTQALQPENRKILCSLHPSFHPDFNHKCHPKDMSVDEIRGYLSHLAMERNVTTFTQTVALSALSFLYRHVLQLDRPYIDDIERAKRLERLPVVFTCSEVKQF